MMLLTFLKSRKIHIDIIGISETKEQSGGFLKNVNLDGYSIQIQQQVVLPY